MSHQHDGYSKTMGDPTARGSHMPPPATAASGQVSGAGQHDAVLPDGSFVEFKTANVPYLSEAVRVDLHRSRLNNFEREWKRLPKTLQVRIKEMGRYPTRHNCNYISGILTGYAEALPNKFDDGYFCALIQALYDREQWVMEEVRGALISG